MWSCCTFGQMTCTVVKWISVWHHQLFLIGRIQTFFYLGWFGSKSNFYFYLLKQSRQGPRLFESLDLYLHSGSSLFYEWHHQLCYGRFSVSLYLHFGGHLGRINFAWWHLHQLPNHLDHSDERADDCWDHLLAPSTRTVTWTI